MIDYTSRDRIQDTMKMELNINKNAVSCVDFLVLHWIKTE
jgi:hypothetical protein